MLEQIVSITEVSARQWQPFEVTSPGGIPFSGYVCRQESEKLGMLAITEMGGEPRLDFVYAMPKIHYPYHQDKDGTVRVVVPVMPTMVDARFTLKLDGTALIFYPLTDKEGNVLEVIPRTRLQPVLTPSRWGDWNALLSDVLPDRTPVEEAVRAQKATLIFELWGYRNPHLVKYDVPLKLTLHTAVRHKKPVSYRRLLDIANRYGLELIPTVETAEPNADGLARAYRRLQTEMEARNQAAGADVFLEEGTILMLSTVDTAVYYKCKPPSIEEIHWTADNTISKENIQQALYKMLEDSYDFDSGSVEDLHAMLETDFEPDRIETAVELIARVYQEFVLDLQQKAWLRQLVADSGIDPAATAVLMRHLSHHYPKNQMSWVYNAVQEMFGDR
ncbi:MAG: hypothetical protein R6X32_23525 [Chloroflexota bacterium]|jgi:hypothetical protein